MTPPSNHQSVANYQSAAVRPASGADGAQRSAPVAPRHLVASLRRDLAIAAGAVLLVAAPLLFTNSGFGLDFTNHLWLSWVQGNGLAQAGHPSYFLNARGIGVFYPWFAFYGGSLYALVGAISNLLGNQPIAAYLGVTLLAIAGSYGGMAWLGRQLGLRGLSVHAPALAVVTSAYYITNLYGRGAWTEFIAVAAIAPLLASGVHLVRARAWRPWPLLVFVLSAVVFSGSHNITLLWGSTVMAVGGTVIWLALGAPRLPLGRLAMLGGLAVACVAVNAWYLLPDLSYAKDVRAHLEVVGSGGALAPFFDTPGVLLDPLRTVPAQSTTPALYVQAPLWLAVWGLLAGAVLLWRGAGDARLRRAWIGMTLVLAVILCMVLITPFWSVVPFPFNEIQFPYRLGSYIFYATGGLVLLGALALQRATDATSAGRSVVALRRALACACAISIGLCAWQLWVPNTLFAHVSYTNRSEALASVNALPRTWYDTASYYDVQAPIVAAPPGRVLIIPPGSVHGDRYAAWLNAPPGRAPIQTNIAGGPYIVHISGLRRVGRDGLGQAVVRREGNGSGPVHVVLETTHSATIELGWLLSILGCAAIVAVFAWSCIRGVARRSRRSALS
jgi:hypothetical protein